MAKHLLKDKLKIINVGIVNFYKSLKEQTADVVQVSFKPEIPKDKKIQSILSKITYKKKG